MKSIIEWYNDLPEDIRAKAIANYDPKFSNVAGITSSLANAIADGFDWEESPEGLEFWMELYQAHRDLQDQPSTLPQESSNDILGNDSTFLCAEREDGHRRCEKQCQECQDDQRGNREVEELKKQLQEAKNLIREIHEAVNNRYHDLYPKLYFDKIRPFLNS